MVFVTVMKSVRSPRSILAQALGTWPSPSLPSDPHLVNDAYAPFLRHKLLAEHGT